MLVPFAATPVLSAALGPTSDAFRVTATVGLWVGWAVTLLAALVERTVSLTILRAVAPGAIVATIWASAAANASAWKPVVGVAAAVLSTACALSPLTGDAFVNGSAYGPERRMALRPTIAALVLAPLAWVAAIAGAASGPLLLAAGQLVAGIVCLVVGVALAVLMVRALHGLSRRWLVFVPAGVVLHDPLTMSDAVLFPRRAVTQLGPAQATDDGLDLTGGAPGLALRIEVDVPQSVGVRRGRNRTDNLEAAALLFTPTRPGAVLEEAERRRIAVG
ncbi:MAG: hypothetical protein JO291_09480 [Acidimicrobiia bacterium]|nr:hypothetical protein [Acidimicrobiia bacterium]